MKVTTLSVQVRSAATSYLPKAADLSVGFCLVYEEGPSMLLTLGRSESKDVEISLTAEQVRLLRARCDEWLRDNEGT